MFSQNDKTAAGSGNGTKAASPGEINIPKIELPKGGGAIRGIEEKFQVNAANGTASFSIPIPLSASRQGFMPGLGLSYNSGNGNSAFGLGWELGIPSITRKTARRLPEYRDADESDVFVYSGAEDLVPKLVQQPDKSWTGGAVTRTEGTDAYDVYAYRPRIEGSFARIERWKHKTTGEVHWRTVSASNVHAYYGQSAESRIADPGNSARVYQWLLCKTHDDTGNIILYRYKQEDFANVPATLSERNRTGKCAQAYLKTVYYGNRSPWYVGDALPSADDFLFRVVLDYGEHDTAVAIPKTIDAEKNSWPCRKDPFSSYRAGFEIRTYRRCSRVLVFHCFDAADLPHKPYLVKSLQLFYDEELQLTGNGSSSKGFSFLTKARQNGHRWDAGTSVYTTKHLPETELTYQQHEWNTTVQTLTEENLLHAPSGLSDKRYLWIDLFSEGIAGILTEQGDGWFYKSNLGNGNFSGALPVAPKPSFTGIADRNVMINELEGNGVKYLVQMDEEPRGYFKLDAEGNWQPFQPFEALPVMGPDAAQMRMIDLTGDGMADLLITTEHATRWHEGLGEKGFAVSLPIQNAIDEEKGPAVLFSDAEQCIFLADFSGDGLTDIARIRNGSVCYWPNLGYGRFGAKVEMEHAPVFDHPGLFNPAWLRLADIDGSGTTDIVYLGKNDFRVWMNRNGNAWAEEAQVVSPFPEVNQLNDVAVLDFLGAGTACIVCSSSAPAQANRALQYIDLMGSKKPALLVSCKNNCGKETVVEYRSSTFYYLDDKKAGRDWITKLPFPVHCISKVTSEDKILETVFVSTYRYRHGYFDAAEREFRGFACVEQYDTEDFHRFKLNSAKNVVDEIFHQPPVRSVSWFHTGAFLGLEKTLHQCRNEYFQNTQFAEYHVPEPELPEGLTPGEYREALRACKGLSLRTEVYAEDGTTLSVNPYSASESNCTIRLVQPRQHNRAASFQVLSSESVSYSYERNPADPRISRSLLLETDELGLPRKAAAIVYPRVARPTGADAVPDLVWDAQKTGHIACSETLYTNDISNDAVYRLRVGCEAKAYEIAGIAIAAGTYMSKEALRLAVNGGTTIRFDEDFTSGVQLRLTGHSRSYFINDAFTGQRPLYEQSPLGIAYKSYALAFTKQLVAKYYGSKVTDAMLLAAKYVHTEGDDHWWTQPGTTVYAANPKDNFYLPLGAKDVFLNASSVTYDAYHLLVTSATNTLGDSVTAENDYRLLSPVLMTDANLNRSAVETDELGMVIKTAVMGKAGAGEGDTLADPTTRLEYNLFNWQVNGKPNYAHSFAREKHGASNPRWQEAYVYSSGSGGVVMSKSQVAPGEAKKWNTATKSVDTVNADPRWLGNGRTIVNNKGSVVKQYDPYFSVTHEYESESALVETGVSPLHHYDPVGRNIKTEFPNGTFAKIVADSWKSTAFDTNDTVKDSQWYIDRGSPDPLVVPEPINDEEKRAAWLAAKHHNTPAVTHSDSLGRGFYSIADYGGGKKVSLYSLADTGGRFVYMHDQKGRRVSESYMNLAGLTLYTKTVEKGEKWVFCDVMGRMVKVWDNDLSEMYPVYDELHRAVSIFVKEKAKPEFVYSRIVYGDMLTDAADRNLKGAPYLLFDQSGKTRIKSVDFKGTPIEVERQLATKYDATIDWKNLEGLLSIALIEAAAAPKLEAEVFAASSQSDALGRPITVTLPDKSVMRPAYDIGNQLSKLEVQVRGTGAFVPFLKEQEYDAKGQRQFVKLGNDMLTNYFYDPKTFRLTNLITKKIGASDTDSIQSLSYVFDTVGNITFTEDFAQQTHFFKNEVVKPQSHFVYDAMYQLTYASGREHAGVGAGQPVNSDLPFLPAIPHVNDSAAVRGYEEEYAYDDCGNILSMDHRAAGGNWKRIYKYEFDDDPSKLTNRLKRTRNPADAEAGPYTDQYTYDAHGNMLSMPHLSSLVWNFADQLRSVDLGGGGKAWYVYGGDGNRVRKVIDRGGGQILERIYLGSVEIYREYQGTDKRIERNTLHISDGAGRIAQVDTKLLDKLGTDPANPLGVDVIRYQYGNNIGSATLETNESGAVISYEEYHPFGSSAYRSAKSGTNLSLKRYRFSGKERDEETGLYYFGARYLAAWLGRWTSSDPAGFVDGPNLYRYCRNSPVMLHDPDGCDPPRGGTRVIRRDRQMGHDASFETITRRIPSGYVLRPDVNAGNYRDFWDAGVGAWAILERRGTPHPPQSAGPPDAGTSTPTNPPAEDPPPAAAAPAAPAGEQPASAAPAAQTGATPQQNPGATVTGAVNAARNGFVPRAGGTLNRTLRSVTTPRAFTRGAPLTSTYNLWSGGVGSPPPGTSIGSIWPPPVTPGSGISNAAQAPGFIMEDTSFEAGADAAARRVLGPGSDRFDAVYGTRQFEEVWGPASTDLARRAGISQIPVESHGLDTHPTPARTVQRTQEIPTIRRWGGGMAGLSVLSGGLAMYGAGQVGGLTGAAAAIAGVTEVTGALIYGGGLVTLGAGESAALMSIGRGMMGVGGGAAGAILGTYQAVQDFRGGHTGWGIVNSIGAAAGVVIGLTALGITSPAWGTAAAVVAVGVGIAGLARWAFGW